MHAPTRLAAWIVGESPASQRYRSEVELAAKASDMTVFLTGPTGTGKTFVAEILHFLSDRAGQRFVKAMCSTSSESLVDSELFGHEAGAFTGADRLRVGQLEYANGGSVLLDEIGEMPLGSQAKLLRFMDDKTITRVGGNVPIRLNVRVIAATHRPLEQEISLGRFSEPLFHRLNVLRIEVPPLRARRDDIPLLVRARIRNLNDALGKRVTAVDSGAMNRLLAHSWPGNIRELEHAVARAMVNAQGEMLTSDDFGAFEVDAARDEPPSGASPSRPCHFPNGLNLEENNRALVMMAMQQAHGNRKEAARLLGISRDQLTLRLKRYGLYTSTGPKAAPGSFHEQERGHATIP